MRIMRVVTSAPSACMLMAVVCCQSLQGAGTKPSEAGPAVLFPIIEADKIGFINAQGYVVAKPQFNRAEVAELDRRDPSFFYGGRALVMVGNNYAYIDQRGSVVASDPLWDAALPFSEGLGAVHRAHKWGYVDLTGKVVIDYQFSSARAFSFGLAVVSTEEESTLGWRSAKAGYVDAGGKWVIPPKFDRASDFSEGLAWVKLEGKGGYVNKSGEMVLQADDERKFSEGLVAVAKDRLWGYVEKSGALVIKPQFDEADDFSEGIAGVRIGGKNAYIDKTGKVSFVSPGLGNVRRPFKEGLAAVEFGLFSWGYVDRNGKTVIPPQFTSVSDFRNGLALVQFGMGENSRYAYVNAAGRVVWKQK